MIANILNIYSRRSLRANYLKMPSSEYVMCHSPVYNFSKGKSKCYWNCLWFIILSILHVYVEIFITSLYEIKLTQPCAVEMQKPFLHYLKKSCSDYVICHSPSLLFQKVSQNALELAFGLSFESPNEHVWSPLSYDDVLSRKYNGFAINQRKQ